VVKVLPAGRTGNRLLNLLPEGDFQRLQPILKRVEFASGQVLYEARGSIDEIVFPISTVLSAVTVMHDGHAIEVATVGNEGLSGLTAFGMVTTSPHRVFAQIPGAAWRVDTDLLNAECQRLPKLREVLTRYQQAFLFQVSQCVACNGLHVIVERCCRWLLMTHDRVDGDVLLLTHEFLSFMLGVRRSGITEVLQSLQQQGLVRYGQGKITVLNREGLENLACECYRSVRDEYDRLLSI
jgi:CRP-like cAMP-binding protein